MILGRFSCWTCCVARPNSSEQKGRKERVKEEKREEEKRKKAERKEKPERKKKKGKANVLPDGFQCTDESHNLGGISGSNGGVGDGRHVIGWC